jgi:hypothetical protein
MQIKTLIIFDWDDTLFPTSWLSSNYINLNSQSDCTLHASTFAKLDNKIYSLLNFCLKYGEVLIITNALLSWVYLSSTVLPKTFNIMRYVKLISARQQASEISSSINNWKIITFTKEYNLRQSDYSDVVYNIISIGDAEYEYNALVNLHKLSKKNLLKSVKLCDNPSLDTVHEQIELLKKNIHKLVTEKRHIDWKFANNK